MTEPITWHNLIVLGSCNGRRVFVQHGAGHIDPITLSEWNQLARDDPEFLPTLARLGISRESEGLPPAPPAEAPAATSKRKAKS